MAGSALEAEIGHLAESVRDEAAWAARGAALRTEYLAGRPWPHVVVEDLFPRALVEAAEEQELPATASLVPHRSHLEVKAENPRPSGPAAAALLDAMCTPGFIAFVEAVTGLERLSADPGHAWSGLAASGPGCFQSMHRDFARHPATGLWHRANVLVYLNSTWQEDWGGFLELWPPDMSACGRRIAPLGRTVVVFATHFDTIHGLPDRVACPSGLSRLSLASYYYNDQPPPGRAREPLVRRPRRPQDPWWHAVAEPRHIALGLVAPLYDRFPAVASRINGARRDAGRWKSAPPSTP